MSDEHMHPNTQPAPEDEATTVLGEPTTVFPTVGDTSVNTPTVDGEATTVLPEATQEEHTPPSAEPAGSDSDVEALASKPQRDGKKRTTLIVAASVAALLLLGGAGFGVWRHQQVQALEQSCEQQVADLQAKRSTLDTFVASDKVQQALKLTGEQVADKSTVTALQQAVKNAGKQVSVPACKVGFFDFSYQPVTVSSTISSKQQAVEQAVAAVHKSATDKQLADAKANLQSAIDQAQQTLDGSDGKVSDNAVRDQLKQAIDQAKQHLADKKLRDVKQLTTETLNNAVNAVNQSVEAKRQADEQAAEQAAAQASTPNYSGYSGSYSGNTYTAPRTNGGYTAPQSTPAPSNNTPQGGSNSSGDEWANFTDPSIIECGAGGCYDHWCDSHMCELKGPSGF